jgi:proteasome accessory factor C
VSASTRLARLLAMLPWLKAHPGVSWTEAAEAFSISEGELLKDLELLWVCGLPGYSPGDLIDINFEGGTIHVIEDAGLSRPLRLNPDEATALVVALRTLADLPGLRDSTALQGALAKLERAAGDAAAANVRVDVDAESDVMEAVQSALSERRRVHLRYYVPARDETTERDVEPMRLLLVDGRAYLEGWCRAVEAVRLFRLDRVEDIAVLAEPSVLPPEAAPRDLEGGLYQPAADDPTAELLLGPSARWIADYYPTESTEEAADGELRVRLRVSDDGWLRRLVLRSGGAARVLAPDELVTAVRADAEAALLGYSD